MQQVFATVLLIFTRLELCEVSHNLLLFNTQFSHEDVGEIQNDPSRETSFLWQVFIVSFLSLLS